MNFLTEVLIKSSLSDIEDTERDLSALTSNVSKCKRNILEYTDKVYVKYSEWPQKSNNLLTLVGNLSLDITNLKNKIESITLTDLSASQLQVETFKLELQQSEVAISCLATLMEIQEKLLKVKEYKTEKKYATAAVEIADLVNLIKAIPEGDLLDITPSLKSNVELEKNFLTQTINQIFEDLIVFKEGETGLMQTNTIKIQKNSEQIQDVMNTLALLNELSSSLSNLKNFIWLGVCKPILSYFTQVCITEDEEFYILSIIIKRTTVKKTYKDVFKNLLQAFTFMYKHLTQDVPEKNVKLYSNIGNELKNDLCNTLLNECLPNTSANPADQQKFQEVAEDTRDFHNELVKLGIFNEDMNPILEHSNNMESMFVNLKCEEYTVQAIKIMKKDLHDMVDVGVHLDPKNSLTGDEFPECTVSKSTIELLEQAERMLKQALTEPPLMATNIICSMQSIFYRYGYIVQKHHEKLLQTIPQQVVLYRNNCMYLAHRLCQLNKVYSPQFPAEVLPFPPIFKDQSHQLRTIGGDIFLGYVETHIKTMERTLTEYGFAPHQLSENMGQDTDKCFRQCLRQYELLKTVWHKVLPHAVYNKTLGYLVHTFCKKLINTVVEAPDISVKNCELLVDMFKIVLTRAPKLFTDSEEINLYVEVWQKFNELVFILTAELISIEDRWRNGALSTYFTAEEVKHLIKALFQNTDRRSYVLSQISSIK